MLLITDLLDEHGVDYKQSGQHKNVRNGWIGVDCPFCGSHSGKYHLGVDLGTNRCTCWLCGWHSTIDVLLALTKESFPVCLKWAEALAGFEQVAPKIKGRLKLPKNLKPLGKRHVGYLQERGFDPKELVEKWKLQGYGFLPGQVPRIFIPITLKSSIVAWTMRSITKQEPRYITAKPEERSKSPNDFLFGQCHCFHTIVIVEGPFDLFRVGYGAVASMGLGLSQKQLLEAVKFPRRVVCYDNEPAAQRQAKQLCAEMGVFPGETYNVCLDAPDPGSASWEEISKLRNAFLD